MNPLDNLDSLHFVTIPRSASHLLAKRINYYFDNQLDQYESFRYRKKEWEEKESKGCHILATHDGALSKKWPVRPLFECPVKPNRKYIVMFRNPLLAIVSQFRLKEENHYKREGTIEEWRTYSKFAIQYTKRFCHKWLINTQYSQGLQLSYEEIRERPENSLKLSLQLMSKNFTHPDEEKIESCIQRYPFQDAPPLEEFKYYDRQYFDNLRNELKTEITFMEKNESFLINVELP